MADRYYNNVFWPKVTICPSCGKSARPIHRRMFPPDPERVFCRFCGEEVKLVTNRLTNADRIRAMSDEELAFFISSKKGSCAVGGVCVPRYDDWECGDCWLDWLKQEVEDGR
jgi:hypothetical protein